MINQLESAFGVSIADDRQVNVSGNAESLKNSEYSRQSLVTVVNELDKTLFEGYAKPKANIAMGILRSGILDRNMDWYETPQPTGTVFITVAKIPRLLSRSFQRLGHIYSRR